MFTLDTISAVIVFGFAFLLSKALAPRGKGDLRDISDARDALNEWQSKHREIHAGDYPSGRKLAENYRDIILACFDSYPEMRNDPTYRAELKRTERLIAPRRSGSFHAIA